jgi:membrane protein DedA with SNARE-associated domain/rhodanese-related sulfurtransferase
MPEPHMPDWPLFQSQPLLCILGLLLLVGMGVPLPVSPALIVAGAMAAHGRLPMALLLPAAPVALLPGDIFWYLLGRGLGHRVVNTVCLVSLSRDVCIQKTQLTLNRFNLRAFLLGRFIPGFGIVAPPIAGATRQPFLPLILYDGLGTLLFTTLFLALGYIFADQLAQLLALLARAGRNLTHVTIAATVLYIAYKAVARYWFAWHLGLPPQQAHKLLTSGTAVRFFDLRSAGDLQKFPFRIASAQRRNEGEIHALLKDVPPTTPVILFCYCPNQASSTQLARKLRRLGFKQAWSLRGGIHGWQSAGLPLEPHAPPAASPLPTGAPRGTVPAT